jgi:hypothetical protein
VPRVGETAHEDFLNFIDDTTRSKVLVSSRVRGVLDGAEIVDIGLPNEEEAVQMLLAVAGLPFATAPHAVKEVVKLCGCLPLSLGIAGKLITELGVTDDWSDVLDLMTEEFCNSGQDRSISIIRTSLSAIKGPNRSKILRLFSAFAVAPEDTLIPIEMVGMMYEAESPHEQPLSQPPSLLSIRRCVIHGRNLKSTADASTIGWQLLTDLLSCAKCPPVSVGEPGTQVAQGVGSRSVVKGHNGPDVLQHGGQCVSSLAHTTH